MSACKQTPPGILSQSEMEDILYDYHLTQGVLDQLSSEERDENTQRYLDAVFSKHGVTEAEFDSSMVWYYRDGKAIFTIYQNVNKRFETFNEELKLKSGGSSYAVMSAEGDTANIWPGNRSIILRSTPLLCCERFNIKSDSTFRRGDKFLLHLTNKFTKEMTDSRNQFANVGLSVEYADGTTDGENRMTENDGTIQLEILTRKDADIKNIYGYFYYSGDNTKRNMCSIRDIALVRMHDMTVQNTAEADTLKADSTLNDSLQKPALHGDTARIKQRLTPEQLHEQMETKENIKIRTAPEIRTRNTYGPTRKKSVAK